MRYVDTVISTTAGLPFQFSLAYATLRATPALEVALNKARAGGWQTFKIEMTRNIAPRQRPAERIRPDQALSAIAPGYSALP